MAEFIEVTKASADSDEIGTVGSVILNADNILEISSGRSQTGLIKLLSGAEISTIETYEDLRELLFGE